MRKKKRSRVVVLFLFKYNNDKFVLLCVNFITIRINWVKIARFSLIHIRIGTSLAFLRVHLSVDLYLAVIFAFEIELFQNKAVIYRLL
ncbi:DUF1290 domain-containing protein [Bacillus pfraonensis]|nr:DUF1290 domain-containing protein [Bacillus pseudomycoides]